MVANGGLSGTLNAMLSDKSTYRSGSTGTPRTLAGCRERHQSSSIQNVNGRIVVSFFAGPGRVVEYTTDDKTI